MAGTSGLSPERDPDDMYRDIHMIEPPVPAVPLATIFEEEEIESDPEEEQELEAGPVEEQIPETEQAGEDEVQVGLPEDDDWADGLSLDDLADGPEDPIFETGLPHLPSPAPAMGVGTVPLSVYLAMSMDYDVERGRTSELRRTQDILLRTMVRQAQGGGGSQEGDAP